MFEIKKIKFNNFDALKMINKETNESISIIPEFGANIFEIVLMKNNKLFNVVKGYTSVEKLKIHHGFFNSHLFPFAGRLPGGKFSYNRVDHNFKVNDLEFDAALHGFLYNQPMKIEYQRSNENKAEIQLGFSSEKIHTSYPFNIQISIIYILDNSGFTCETKFINNGDSKAPIAYGVHPYFRFDTKVNDLDFKIQTNLETILNDGMVPSGETKITDDFLDFVKISDRFFDNGFQFSRKENIVTTQLRNSAEDTTINIWQETGKHKFNFLQVYTPPTRDCIAVEPLCGNINSLNSKDDLMELDKGEKASMKWGVRLS